MLNKAKDFYYKHQHRITPAWEFARACIASTAAMKEKPGWIDYLEVALEYRDNYYDVYLYNKPKSYFVAPRS